MLNHVTFFDQYLKSLGYGSKFTGISNINNNGGKTCRIDFTEDASEEDKTNLYTLRDSYNWESPDWWLPQVKEFRIAVFNSLPAEGKVLLAPVLMSLTDEFISNPSSMQAYWGALVEMSPQWLDEKVIGDVLHAAQKFNIPLISEGK